MKFSVLWERNIESRIAKSVPNKRSVLRWLGQVCGRDGEGMRGKDSHRNCTSPYRIRWTIARILLLYGGKYARRGNAYCNLNISYSFSTIYIFSGSFSLFRPLSLSLSAPFLSIIFISILFFSVRFLLPLSKYILFRLQVFVRMPVRGRETVTEIGRERERVRPLHVKVCPIVRW